MTLPYRIVRCKTVKYIRKFHQIYCILFVEVL